MRVSFTPCFDTWIGADTGDWYLSGHQAKRLGVRSMTGLAVLLPLLVNKRLYRGRG